MQGTSGKTVNEMLIRMDKIADWALDPDDKRTRTELGKDIGCAAITISKNITDDRYLEILKQKTKRIIKNLMPKAVKGLTVLLETGEAKTVRWFFEQAKMFEDEASMSDRDILDKVISGYIDPALLPNGFTGVKQDEHKE